MDVQADRVVVYLQRRVAEDARMLAIQAAQIEELEIENTRLRAPATSTESQVTT